MPPRTHADYTVGWISALPIELAAARLMLDQKHTDLSQLPGDNNIYSFGSIGSHNVVLACCPAGQTGISSATAVAMQMKSSFPAIRFGLMVGVGGGVPSKEVDIRLGDVVVSQPTGRHGGVIQYDFGKTRPDKFEPTGFLNAPPEYLLAAVTKLRSSHDIDEGRFYEYVSQISERPKFSREAAGTDTLFDEDSKKAVTRAERTRPEIHYGTIASGNQVMRYGKDRDKISAEFGGVLCFEMEAAGLMNSFPCLVIRGICDYADSSKDKRWQPYASATAAAYAKDLLGVIPQMAVMNSRTVLQAIDDKPATALNQTNSATNNHGMQIGTSNTPIHFSVDQNQSGIQIKNSTVLLSSIERQGGVTINSKSMTSADIVGQTHVSLRPVATFVARPSLYNQLRARLHATLETRGPSSKIMVICGLGGAGKSQLVLHYIQTHQSDYAAVFWVEAGSRATLERDCIQIWRLLSRSSDDKISIDDALRGVKAWLRAQQDEKKWLIVFDSADNIDDEAHKDYVDLNTFAPDAPCIDIIITTRSQTAKEMTDIEEIQVGDLDKEEALELLLRCSKIKNVTENQKHEAVLIVKELGHFALAVALAGAHIAATPRIRSRLDTYLPEYRQQRKTLLGRKAQRQVHQYGESVLTTWETSYAAIASQCPEALGLLRLLAFLSADDIFYELFAPLSNQCSKSASIWSRVSETSSGDDVVTQATLDGGFAVLSKYSLLAWKEEQSSFAMHKLVHTWGYDRMTIEEQSQHGQEALMYVGDLLTWRSYQPAMRARLLPHLMGCFSRLQEWYQRTKQMRKESLTSIGVCCDFLRDNGYYAQGIDVCLFRCEALRHLSYDRDHKTVLDAEHDLAEAYRNLGHWGEADLLDVSILERRQRVLGEKHPDTLTSMANLAVGYSRQGRYKDAAELGVKVLEIMKRVLGEEHLSTLKSMGNLALTYRYQGRYENAAELEVKVLGMKQRVLGEEHPSTLTSMANLALMYKDQGRYEVAAELFVKVLEVRKRVLGEEHPDTLTSMSNLASVYSKQRRYEDAAELGVKVLGIRKRVLGEEHPSTLTSMNDLSLTYSDQGRYEDAAELQAKVVESYKRVLGEEHPWTLTSMNNLASVYSRQGRFKDAAELGVKVLEIMKRVLGEEHPETLASMNNLAVTLLHQDRLQEACELMRQCVDKRTLVLGVAHPHTTDSVSSLQAIQKQLDAAAGDESGILNTEG